MAASSPRPSASSPRCSPSRSARSTRPGRNSFTLRTPPPSTDRLARRPAARLPQRRCTGDADACLRDRGSAPCRRPSWPAPAPPPGADDAISARRTVAPGNRPSPAGRRSTPQRIVIDAAHRSAPSAPAGRRPSARQAAGASAVPEPALRRAERGHPHRPGARPRPAGAAGVVGGVPAAMRRRGIPGAQSPAGGKKPPARRPRARGAGRPAGARPRQADPRAMRRDEAHPPVEAAAPRDHDARRTWRLRALRGDLAGALPSLSGAAPQASADSETGGACSGWAPTTPSACSAEISAAL